MGRKKKPKQPKPPKYLMIDRSTKEGQEIHKLVTELVREHHDHLRNASIAYCWMIGNKGDKDGRLILGKMKKASELDRELHAWDLCLLLNRETWRVFSIEQKRALVDHELCHADLNLGKDGEPVEDPHGKKTYRIRKHDIEEFAAVVRRHGIYKADLERFAEALEQGRQQQLFRKKDKAA